MNLLCDERRKRKTTNSFFLKVHPDSRKGLVYIHQGPDTLMHFCWKDRTSSTVNPDDDLVIFANEVEFKKVTQNTTGKINFQRTSDENQRRFRSSLYSQMEK